MAKSTSTQKNEKQTEALKPVTLLDEEMEKVQGGRPAGEVVKSVTLTMQLDRHRRKGAR